MECVDNKNRPRITTYPLIKYLAVIWHHANKTLLQNDIIRVVVLSSLSWLPQKENKRAKMCVPDSNTFSWWKPERKREKEMRPSKYQCGDSKRVRAIWDRMSLSISCVMKNDWGGLHGPRASEDGGIAMHRALHFRLSKLRPAACEVRLQKGKRSGRLNVSPLTLYPLNDMVHSYKQLTFKDTSTTSEKMKQIWTSVL